MGIQKLCIGTAQFGMHYGRFNQHGQVSVEDVQKIFHLAEENGISFIDTAHAYGNSEEVIGKYAKKEAFQIISKTAIIANDTVTADDVVIVDKKIKQSYERLQVKRLYGLLVHHAQDLLKPGGERLYELLATYKQQNLVHKIGVSVYEAKEIEQIISKFPIDLVQVPVNIFDQRLVKNGMLTKLKQMGIEIHARSIFLQGLLLQDFRTLDPFFQPIINLANEYDAFLKIHGVTKIQAAYQFVKQLKEIDRIIIGIENYSQFQQVIHELSVELGSLDFRSFAINEEHIVNPSRWEKGD
jgi:aryl-alcohol dehydrogenase-like predicted oxidoreductase